MGARADPSVPLSRIFLHPDNTSMQSRGESQLTYTDAHHNPNPRPLRASHLLAVIRVNSLFLHQSVIATTILLQPPTDRIYMHTAIWGQLPFSRNPQCPHDTLTSSIRASDTLQYYTCHAQKPFCWIVGSILFNIAPALPFSPSPSMPWMCPPVWQAL